MEYTTKKTSDGKILYYRGGVRIAKSKVPKKYLLGEKVAKVKKDSSSKKDSKREASKREASKREALCDQHRFSLILWPFEFGEHDSVKLSGTFDNWKDFVNEFPECYVLTLIHYVKKSKVWDWASVDEINEEKEIIQPNTLVLMYLVNNGDANIVEKVVIHNVTRSMDGVVYKYLKKTSPSLGF